MFVAVTGASGRIGRAVVQTLAETGHRVRSIDRTPAEHEHEDEFVEADACDYQRLRAAVQGTEGLIHLAGIPNPDVHEPHTVHNTNVVASYNALTAAVETGITKICLASSINAIGGAFSRHARYDYFPVDEQHPTYNEDPYSLSKWIAEQQADSVARRHSDLTVASLRIHGAVPDRAAMADNVEAMPPATLVNQLWGYVRLDAVARASLQALRAAWSGHEVFNIVAPDTMMDTDSRELARRHWPEVPLRAEFEGNRGFYDCGKAARMLRWSHAA